MNEQGINVLSLFDGMSCGQIALERAGIKVNNYYASEIDKHAIAVTQKNFPNTIQLGDVTKVKGSDLPKMDLIIGGSPCQGFSFAGKGLNFEDQRSKLFFEFVRLIKECNPKWFFLENVKMKKEHELVISQYMKVAPIEINSALVSAQNRVRLYWTNINEKPYGLFGDIMTNIPQPKDKGILLKDILESDVPDKFYLSDKMVSYLTKNSVQQKDKGNGFKFSPCYDFNSKGKSLTTKPGQRMDDNFIVASRGRNPENPKSRVAGLPTEQQLEARTDGKTNTITSVQKDNLVMQIPEATKKGYAEVKPGECFDLTMPKSETRRGRLMEDKSNCLTAAKFDFMQYTEDYRIRRLTPTECERLQTVPDGYTNYVSDTQRYRMLGNGWTVDVIAHIFNYMKTK
jgi:DNA (cytosine-5)-methyltransferase 3A